MDLGQEYYFFMFMSKENQHTTLLEGMWFIYDHYLIVRKKMRRKKYKIALMVKLGSGVRKKLKRMKKMVK